MKSEHINQFLDFNEKIFNSLNSGWIQTAAESYKKLIERQTEFNEATLKSLTSHASHLANAKSPQEFIESQQEFIHENLHRGMKQLQENLVMTAEQLESLLPCCQVKAERKVKQK